MRMLEPKELKVLFNNVLLQYPAWNEEGDYPKGELCSFGGYIYKAAWNPELNAWQQRNIDKCPSIYSSVNKQVYEIYDPTKLYAKGAIVIDKIGTITPRIALDKSGSTTTVETVQNSTLYECIADMVTPYDITNNVYWRKTVPFWEIVGIENKYAALYDFSIAQSWLNSLSSIMKSTGNIVLEFDTSNVSRLALLGMYGTQLTVEFFKYVSPSYVLEKTYTRKLYTRPYINGMMSWLFGGFEFSNQQDYVSFPRLSKSKVRVTISTRSGKSELALACVGNERFIGSTKYGASMSIEDYSKNEINTLGMRTVKEGSYKFSHSVVVNINKTQIDFVRNFLTRFRATPTIYVSMDDVKSSIIFGYYKNWTIVRDGWKKSTVNITVNSQ